MKNIREAWNYNTKLGTDSVQLPYKVKVNNSSKLTFSVEKHYVLCINKMNAVEFNLKINKLNKTWQKYILLKQ